MLPYGDRSRPGGTDPLSTEAPDTSVRAPVWRLDTDTGSLTPSDHPVALAAARALEATFGRAPVYIREGGSIPVSASLDSILGLPVVLLGFAPPDSNAHAPNEWMDLGNYETSIRTIARLWAEFADLRR